MMISKEQAQAAAQHLKDRMTGQRSHMSVEVSAEVLAAACAVAEGTPDTRPHRVEEARHSLNGDGADSHVVASMMIHRIISDSLR